MMGEPREAAAGPSPDTTVRLVYVTVATREVGEKLARTLVEERLAACVNVVEGITSFYWWEGEVQRVQHHVELGKTAPRNDGHSTLGAPRERGQHIVHSW